MRLKGSSLTTTLFGFLPILGGGSVINNTSTPALADGLPVKLEGTNGDFVFTHAFLTSSSFRVYASGSLVALGQSVPFKSISLTNQTNTTQGKITVLAAEFGTFLQDGPNFYAQATGLDFSSYIASGGDDVDYEIEFNNNVIGVITG